MLNEVFRTICELDSYKYMIQRLENALQNTDSEQAKNIIKRKILATEYEVNQIERDLNILSVDTDQVLITTVNYFGISLDQLKNDNSKPNIPKKAAIFILYNHYNKTDSEIGKLLDETRQNISWHRSYITRNENPVLILAIEEILNLLNNYVKKNRINKLIEYEKNSSQLA